ncbi:peptidoglycan DD-metalloendopeptidase family protein [Microbacterium sp. bgisy207]|uniref:M23 family metallopeptidase n=1 Tax=Microbacterium sp. bgisy207 TaxID=3413800 RepID=UPI003EB807B9
MTPETPAADAARTRRSSRTTPAPAQAPESSGPSRAELRRTRRVGAEATGSLADARGVGASERAGDPPTPRPAGLRSRAHNAPLTDAEADALAGAGLDATRHVENVRLSDEVTAAAAPLTRRARRSISTPIAPSTDALPLDDAVAATPINQAPATAPVTRPIDVHVSDAPHEPVIADTDADATPLPAVADAASESFPGFVTDVEPESPADEVDGDIFERTVRMFGATGATATLPAEPAPSAEASGQSDPSSPAPEHIARRRPRAASVRRLTTTSFSVGVMGIVGLLAVGMTTPVEAVAAAGGGEGSTASIVAVADGGTEPPVEDIQAYVAPAEASTAALSREEGYSAVSMAELAVEAGVRETAATYVNNSTAAVQYPFVVGVPISSPYGMRWGRLHEGVDFAPGGQGAEIHAVADGIVRIATEAGGAYGVQVVIDSIVNGELVSTNYAHMQYGSLRVEAGQVVKLGDVVGTVGTTGRSTGPHLHFEVLLNGKTPTEPMAWLAAHNVASTVVTVPQAPITVDQ